MIDICSLSNLEATIASMRPDLVVSAVPASVAGAQLLVPIIDILNRDLRLYKTAIRAVLASPEEKILFHCEQGKSRSGALALAKVYQRDPGSVGEWIDAHPEAEPNPLLLLFADQILEAHGHLLAQTHSCVKGKRY